MEVGPSISWTYRRALTYRSNVAILATRSAHPSDPAHPSGRAHRTDPAGPRRAARATSLSTLYRSTIGKKIVMAVTGLLMLAFVIVHMLGNLKIFFGQQDFDHYAHWLRTIGEPIVRETWYLWIQRTVLTVALVAHVWAAASLSRQDRKARPIGYQHRRRGGYATSTMRWGGVILLLFIVYHILDLTMGVANPGANSAGPYGRVVADFNIWYITLAYVVAMVALGLHIAHGLWSAANTLGVNAATTNAYRIVALTVAVGVTGGFLIVPFGVIVGWVG
jgi:succinate dehydrogenase / fumarate reductase cytochrome b subunit